MQRILAIASMLLAAGACKKAESKDEPGAKSPVAKAPSKACEPDETTGALKWIADDFEAAITCATERKVPVVLDMWAPWCHTCLSMQSEIFTDPAFAPFADRFVFTALDTDREENALPVAAYPPSAWPTFWVISPNGEIQGRFVGAASVDQFRDFLTQGEQAFLDGEQLPADQPLALVRTGDRAAAAAKTATDKAVRQAKLAEAQAAYEQALAKAPPDWPRRPDVLVSTLGALRARGPAEACVDFALAHLGETGRAASATDFLGGATNCADERAATAPEHAKALWTAGAARLEALIADATAPLSADDRSDAMTYLREFYDKLGRPDDARKLAEQQRVFLDDAAAKADGPLASMTYIWPRCEVYAYLGKHAELVPALEQLAKDLPEEYEPLYRLAWLHKDAKQYDAAIGWARKALALVYGPRKAKAQQMLVDLLAAKGDAAAERTAREELIAILEALPPELGKPADLEKARAELAAMPPAN